MPVAPVTINKAKLLLGEGVDEVRFFNALLAQLAVQDIQVGHYGGKTQLANYLLTLPLQPGFVQLTCLAVTRDADANAVGAFRSVCSALQAAGLSVPSAHGQSAGTAPRVHVFILPDGQQPGMLEDLCLSSVQADPAWPCVEDYFTCVSQSAARQPNNPAKARVHAWLASQIDPDKRLGEAAEAGYWPWSSPAFDLLKQFLQGL
jgi:hypothetical protein